MTQEELLHKLKSITNESDKDYLITAGLGEHESLKVKYFVKVLDSDFSYIQKFGFYLGHFKPLEIVDELLTIWKFAKIKGLLDPYVQCLFLLMVPKCMRDNHWSSAIEALYELSRIENKTPCLLYLPNTNDKDFCQKIFSKGLEHGQWLSAQIKQEIMKDLRPDSYSIDEDFIRLVFPELKEFEEEQSKFSVNVTEKRFDLEGLILFPNVFPKFKFEYDQNLFLIDKVDIGASLSFPLKVHIKQRELIRNNRLNEYYGRTKTLLLENIWMNVNEFETLIKSKLDLYKRKFRNLNNVVITLSLIISVMLQLFDFSLNVREQ